MTALSKLNTRAPLDRSPKKNWVERSGGLPMYVRRIANHLHAEKGMTISHAIAVAVNVVKKMCASGELNWPGHQTANPKSRGEACAAVASWEKKKASARVAKGIRGRRLTDAEFIEFLIDVGGLQEVHKGCNCGDDDMDGYQRKNKRRKKRVAKTFDPNQPRNPKNGRWIPTGKELSLRGKELSDFNSLEDEQKVQYANVKHSPEGIAADINHEQALASARAYDAEALRAAFELIDRMQSGEKIDLDDLEEPKKKKKNLKKRDFSHQRRMELKAKGLTDPHGGFPLPKKIDVKNAIRAIGRAKNPELEKRRIIARAKALGCTNLIPDSWNVSKLQISDKEFAELEKGLEQEFDTDLEKIDADIDEFWLEGDIEKSDPDKQLVFGWCSVAKLKDGTDVVDKQGDVIEDIEAMEKVAYDFVLHSRDGGEMHVRKGVSTLVESFVSTPEKWEAMEIPEGTLPIGWWVGFRVNDSEVWKGVKSGKYKMFSVHGTGLRKAIEA